jgi:hypothetical protein
MDRMYKELLTELMSKHYSHSKKKYTTIYESRFVSLSNLKGSFECSHLSCRFYLTVILCSTRHTNVVGVLLLGETVFDLHKYLWNRLELLNCTPLST